MQFELRLRDSLGLRITGFGQAGDVALDPCCFDVHSRSGK
jgi:hypothetical protein